MIKNIIFDFDGVLVDSEILVAKAFSKYFANKNISFSVREFVEYAGKKTVQIIEDLSTKFNIKDQKIFFDDIMNIANEIYRNDLEAVSGAEEFLQNKDFNFLIGSNSFKKRIIVGLKKINFEKFFPQDKIFSFDIVQRPKPEPDIYLAAIESHKLNKEETIIIEDSVVGVNAGVSAGIKVIGLTAGKHWFPERSSEELIKAGAFILIDNYDNLLKEINKL